MITDCTSYIMHVVVVVVGVHVVYRKRSGGLFCVFFVAGLLYNTHNYVEQLLT